MAHELLSFGDTLREVNLVRNALGYYKLGLRTIEHSFGEGDILTALGFWKVAMALNSLDLTVTAESYLLESLKIIIKSSNSMESEICQYLIKNLQEILHKASKYTLKSELESFK